MSRAWKLLIESKLVHFFTLFVWPCTNWGITTCNIVLRPLYSTLLFTVRQKGVLEENNTNINNWLEFGKCYGTTWRFKLLSFVVAVATVFFFFRCSSIQELSWRKNANLQIDLFIMRYQCNNNYCFFFEITFSCILAFVYYLLHY